MKLLKHFDAFLKNKVNLSDSRIDDLDGHVSAVRTFLSTGSDDIASNFKDLVPQGSYAQRTIINPVGINDEFDADVLLDMEEVEGWAAEDYVQGLYEKFRASSTYRDKVNRRTRCVVVDYAGDFHMDVVPFLTRHEQRYITNRNKNLYELTNPEGFTEWLDGQNRLASGRLVKVIRLLKFVRDLKNTFDAKSVILTILLGGRISDASLMADPHHYEDLPTAFVNLLEDLSAYLLDNETMPSIDDPSCPSENFNHRWDQDKYATFRDKIRDYAEWARDAYDEEDSDRSVAKWRRLFGDSFGTFPTSVQKASQAHLTRPGVQNTEEFAHERWTMALVPAYHVKIEGRSDSSTGFSPFVLSRRGNRVGRRRKITFRATSINVPPPYEVWWKVRNTGEEALQANAIRGQLIKDDGTLRRTEPTAYKGDHYVEVYVVKNGTVVARDRHPVFIR